MQLITALPNISESKMPLYEYRCQFCQSSYEKIGKPEDCQIDRCPGCGGRAQRVVSGFSWKNQTSNLVKFQDSSDEKMYYAEKRLNEDKSLDPNAWLLKVAQDRLAEKAAKSAQA